MTGICEKPMRVRHSESALPRDWSGLTCTAKAIFECDLSVQSRGRLRAKLLVFRNKTDLHRFWKTALGTEPLGRRCVGAVNALAHEVVSCKGGVRHAPVLRVDPRYFCVIGLVVGHIGMEVVTHEAGHAGFAYARRCRFRNMWGDIHDMDEEQVCYPSGRIANEIVIAIDKAGLNASRRQKR